MDPIKERPLTPDVAREMGEDAARRVLVVKSEERRAAELAIGNRKRRRALIAKMAAKGRRQVYFVRWFDPTRKAPLRRDFHTKREADTFRDRLPYLAEVRPYPNKPRRPRVTPPAAPAVREQITWGPTT